MLYDNYRYSPNQTLPRKNSRPPWPIGAIGSLFGLLSGLFFPLTTTKGCGSHRLLSALHKVIIEAGSYLGSLRMKTLEMTELVD